MAPCNENCEHKARSDKRLAFMADRMAVMLCIIKSRHNDWEWLYGEDMWTNPDGMAAELRDWSDYRVATDIVRLWLKKHDARERVLNV